MRTFDVYRIGGDLYLVMQADHLLGMNTVVVVPVLPASTWPALRKLTVEVTVGGEACRVATHMPLTVEAGRIRHLDPVHHLGPDEAQAVRDGLNTILRGL